MMAPSGMARRFEGKVVLISGAGSGIGAAAARRFRAEGARLATCDLRPEGLEALATEAGDDIFIRTVDVEDGAAYARFVDEAAAHFGQLDVLVNNAGISGFGHVDEILPETWRRILSVDLDAVFLGSRAALPHLRATRGCIVNTASISGLLADAGLVAYNVAKAGVIHLTRSMAVDHGPEGIRVNCVCPGGVGTPMLVAHTRDPGIMDEYARLVPMGRLAEPEEIAAGILFLASADASFITGHPLVVDGGVTAQTGQPNWDRLYRERGWDKKMLSRQNGPAR